MRSSSSPSQRVSFLSPLPSPDLLANADIPQGPLQPLSREGDLHYLADYACPITPHVERLVAAAEPSLFPTLEPVDFPKITAAPSEIPALAGNALAMMDFVLPKPDLSTPIDTSSSDFVAVSQ